jgi:DNA-binding CsgD family transcriptional regulator
VRVVVQEPILLYREILCWHLSQPDAQREGFTVVDGLSGIASNGAGEGTREVAREGGRVGEVDGDVVVVWRPEHRPNTTRIRSAALQAPGQRPIRTGAELRTLLASVGSKRSWMPPALSPDPPSKQELAVLEDIAAGLTTRQIAEQRNVSEHTIVGHRRRLFRRWGVHSAQAAVQLALKHGYLKGSG